MTLPNHVPGKTTERLWYKEMGFWFKTLMGEAKLVILEEPVTRYIIYITSIIASLIVFEMTYDGLISVRFGWMPFLSSADKWLVMDFIEWFGVLYGVLMPILLIQQWKQFDKIDSVFDREADAIKILAEDMSLMLDTFSETRTKMLKKLLQYSEHVREHHAEEIKFADSIGKRVSEKDIGAQHLKEVRDLYRDIIHPVGSSQQEVSPLVAELLRELNTIIDLRGDRISLSSERLYESLKLLAIITSIVWLVPFYFLYYPEGPLGIFGWLLVIAVTFLVIMFLTLLDDLDNPFDGLWKINLNSWDKLIADINEMLNDKDRKGRKRHSIDKTSGQHSASIIKKTPSKRKNSVL